MLTFEDVLKKLHLIEDIILSKIATDEVENEDIAFSKHLISTKQWFIHVSWQNKKEFLLNLIRDEQSVRPIFFLLKSIWNCRPKDAVISTSERSIYTSYDQVPMDYNRTAQPVSTLKKIMAAETEWFQSLDIVHRTLYLLDLLTLVGGPVMWEVLRFCQQIYEEYVEKQNCMEAVVVPEPPDNAPIATEQQKKIQTTSHKIPTDHSQTNGKPVLVCQDDKELERQLASWAAKMKAMRDSLKLEELELTSNNGTKRRIWKSNRPKPDAIETVDLIQLLPSSLGKKILMYLPPSQLVDCARVNKYWSFLVEEIRLELAARQKINVELEKIRRYDVDFDQSQTISEDTRSSSSYIAKRSKIKIKKRKKQNTTKPIMTMSKLNERLNRRGAADPHIWRWCKQILKFYKDIDVKESDKYAGLMVFGETYFPCPMMDYSIKLPLDPPLTKDFTKCQAIIYLKIIELLSFNENMLWRRLKLEENPPYFNHGDPITRMQSTINFYNSPDEGVRSVLNPLSSPYRIRPSGNTLIFFHTNLYKEIFF